LYFPNDPGSGTIEERMIHPGKSLPAEATPEVDPNPDRIWDGALEPKELAARDSRHILRSP
jgi:hypothetical protein